VREAAEQAGRDPDAIATGVYLTVAVADSPSDAAAELDVYIRAYYGVPADRMAATMALHAGTLESAAECFAAYRSAGARHVVVRLARPSLGDYSETVSRLLGAARIRR
jgi:alkanesulfonate monooxygenase SsuD/methylene tetrahydromethanopterin reductase-like flavin-dependent oxidoreductase (luciferase family)